MIELPILRSSPFLDIGIPVSRASLCFACEIPNALFHEKESPGMGVDFLLIYFLSTLYIMKSFQ